MTALVFAIAVMSPSSVQSQKAAPAATPVGILGETPGSVPVSLLIQQTGARDDRLLGGRTPLAQRVETHRARLNDGVREMVLAPDGLEIPGETTMILEPESDHLMLIGLTRNLVQGETFPLTLRFARAGEVPITVRVRRKVDAAGLTPIPPVTAGSLIVSLASAPPAAAIASP